MMSYFVRFSDLLIYSLKNIVIMFAKYQERIKGGTVALVKMTSYTNLTKTTIKTYRKGYKDACKYLNASKKEATFFVVKDQAETLVVSMSTTSGESTLAQGNFIR